LPGLDSSSTITLIVIAFAPFYCNHRHAGW
jgi:hypothetical protein